MPIFSFLCEGGCGQRVEVITKSASTQVPAQVRQKCPRCGMATMFAKTVGVPAIRTPTTTAVARRNDYQRKNPNAKENVIAGKTAAGRPLNTKSKNRTGSANTDYGVNQRRPNGSVIPQRVLDSHADWNDSYSETYDRSMDDARNEVQEMAKE